jgi:predicted sugar kinase
MTVSSKESAMETVYDTLYERVDELIRSHKGVHPVLSTTAIHVVIAELVARSEGLEQAIREIALEVQELAASQQGAASASGH